MVAGSGEAPEGQGNYRDCIIARGDTGPTGLRGKALWVLGEMQRRMAAVGGSWHDTTGVQLCTEFDVPPFVADELARRGAMRHGLGWHFNRPPVREIDCEMDCRASACVPQQTGAPNRSRCVYRQGCCTGAWKSVERHPARTHGHGCA